MTLQPGVILHQRYRIVKSLGQGGFGAMYRAWDMTLDRQCAIKENLDTSPEARRQFLREAKILANLSHPNLPRVTDYFFIQLQGQYLVMDYVEGQDLQEMIDDQGGGLPEDRVLPWIEQVCEALEYLHSQNLPIIHRDIKPANIKITPQGQAMLVDFGIAKLYDPNLKTTVGAQAVTAGFSPVEQYGKGVTDARSDLYALGATLYALLTGEEPPESVGRVVHDPLTPPRKLNPAISHRTEASLLRVLQIDPDQRFQRAADFKAALSTPRQVVPPAPSALPAPRDSNLWRWIGVSSLIALASLALFSAVVLRGVTWRDSLAQTSQPALAAAQTSSPGPRLSATVLASTGAAVPATLTKTNTPQASSTPLTYLVQEGDTCLQIALTYGVSLESIVRLNELPPDCGLLLPGQMLLIPALFEPEQRATTVDASPTAPLPVATRVAGSDGMAQVYVPAGSF
ncbi:MAG: protein kinase, partial [Anaerolineales bacterium]|nr:protein kinase [Anaerolineales bacterium]